MSIADKLLTIAENQSKVYDAGKVAVLKGSKYMRGTANGEVVAVNDVSPVEHDVGVQVTNKNLIELSKFTLVGCLNNGDGTLTANMNNVFYCRISTASLNELFLSNRGNKFTFSVKEIPNDTKLVVIVYGKRPATSQYRTYEGAVGSRSLTFTMGTDFETINSVDLRMLVKADARYDDTTTVIRDIQLEFGETATAYAPYIGDFSQVNVSRYGKNLFENDTSKLGEVNYTTSSGEARTRIGYAFYLPAGTYTQRAIEKESGNGVGNYIYTTGMSLDGRWIFSDFETHLVANAAPKASTFTVNEDIVYYVYREISTENIDLAKALFEKFDFQIERGSTVTEYEPFVAPITCTANADGTVEGVRSLSPSMTLTTNTNDVTINCSYLRDIDTYIDGLGGA